MRKSELFTYNRDMKRKSIKIHKPRSESKQVGLQNLKALDKIKQ